MFGTIGGLLSIQSLAFVAVSAVTANNKLFPEFPGHRIPPALRNRVRFLLGTNETKGNGPDWWQSLCKETDQPFGSRSHSAALYSPSLSVSNQSSATVNQEEKKEYMIITGGFSDSDWGSFPVYTVDITTASAVAASERGYDYGIYTKENSWLHIKNSGRNKMESCWVDFSPTSNATDATTKNTNEEEQLWPRGRVGHITSVQYDRNDESYYLYMFGGLLWNRTSENDVGDQDHGEMGNGFLVQEELYVWRTKIGEAVRAGYSYEKGNEDSLQAGDDLVTMKLVWEKITPKVLFLGDNGTLGSSITRGYDTVEIDISKSDHDDSNAGNNGNRRGLKQTKRNAQTNVQDSHLASTLLPRGECAGGHWPNGGGLIIYGGLHITNRADVQHYLSPSPHIVSIVTPLGDVWMYQYNTSTFLQLASYPPDEWQRDYWSGEDNMDDFWDVGETNDDNNNTGRGLYPLARTAHAATVVGDELIIYGGMSDRSEGENGDDTNNMEEWYELSDVWVFDLVQRKWKQRYMYPPLSRSYHTMVGWKHDPTNDIVTDNSMDDVRTDDYSGNSHKEGMDKSGADVAIFGGLRTAQTFAGEPIATVLSDTIISRANNDSWMQAKYHGSDADMLVEGSYSQSIQKRWEHSAVVDQFGSMFVWGGRCKNVFDTYGLWSLDVFGKDTNVRFDVVLTDEFNSLEAELEALHLMVAIMFFMSVLFTVLYGTLQRHAGLIGGGGENDGVNSVLGRRHGLSRASINLLPVKRYARLRMSNSSAGDDFTINSDDEEDRRAATQPAVDDECCPICLVEYEQGEEIRTLPCNHDFHKDCVDSWLDCHTSCPACRHSVVCGSPHSQERSTSRLLHRIRPRAMIPIITLPHFMGGERRRWFGPVDQSHDTTEHGNSIERNTSAIEGGTVVATEQHDELLDPVVGPSSFPFGRLWSIFSRSSAFEAVQVDDFSVARQTEMVNMSGESQEGVPRLV